MPYAKVTDRELEFIKGVVGSDRVSTGESVLDLHGHDESFHPSRRPEVVVWPHSAEEVSQILKMANEKRIPVTPWGAGTSLEGNPIPVEGGIVLDLQQMNRILELNEEDLQVRVEAGVIYKELNQHLARVQHRQNLVQDILHRRRICHDNDDNLCVFGRCADVGREEQ